jgi:hypothetical protein
MRALAVALTLAAAPAAAQGTVHWKTVGWWDVQFFPEYGACAAIAEYDNDSFVFFGLDTTFDDLGLRVAILNHNWSSIVVDDDYQLVVRFDRRAPWDITMYGTEVQGRRGLYNIFPATSDSAGNFVREFQRSIHMVWTYQGSELGDFSLKGTNMAMNEVMACTESYLDAVATPSDPFEQGGGSSKKGDPFQ